MSTDWSLYTTAELKQQLEVQKAKTERLRILSKANRIPAQTYWDARSVQDAIEMEISKRPADPGDMFANVSF